MMQCPKLSILLCSLVVVGLGRATVFMAVADPNACIQSDFTPMVPFSLPAPEPNEPWGAVLGPVSGDPNVWTVPAGAWKRDWALFCDAEGDLVTIAGLGGTSAVEVQIDASQGLWSFSAVVVEGPNLWRFDVRDDKGADRIVTVAVWGQKNAPPVLR
ncbi:MAG: hypothetical protein EHM80_15795 [Nitrospiraceae bacterium]|nr:MAG: hypothetical protein EHM80_15795 [Nitrospiraceae bacterium]